MTVKLSHFALALISITLAQSSFAETALPKPLLSFIDAETKLRDFKSADLNGDGLNDFLLVLEHKDGMRTLKIITAQPDGKWQFEKSSDVAVYCKECGGAFGDPYESINAKTKSFTIRHLGGSASRWSVATTFNYSKRDSTWQLVKVEESEFETSQPNKVTRRIYIPPKHFGKIDFADFDPEDFQGRGEK